MTEAEDTDFGRELIASMQEAAAIVRGEKDAARVHLPPAVQQEDDLLVALLLVLARHRPAQPRGGLPVDLAQRVALAVLAQLVELEPFAAAPALW